MRSILFCLILLAWLNVFSYELIYYEDFEGYQPGEIPDNWTVNNDSLQSVVELDGNKVFRGGGLFEQQIPPAYELKLLWQAPVADTSFWTGLFFSTHVEDYYDPSYMYFYAKDTFSVDGIFISDPSTN